MLQHPRHTEKALALGRPALDKQNQATITAKITNKELAKAVATGRNLAQLALETVSSEFEGGESLAKAGFMAALQHQMRKLDSGAEEQKAKADHWQIWSGGVGGFGGGTLPGPFETWPTILRPRKPY